LGKIEAKFRLIEMTEEKFTKEQIQALADFWPVFANPKFVYETQDEVKEKNGVITMPSSSLSPEAKAFNKMIYLEGWILDGFDWPEWAQTDEFKDLFSKAEALAKASADQLAQLLTALARKERFCEGTMASACSDGLLARITQRAGVLV
jgi:hypothetical protein